MALQAVKQHNYSVHSMYFRPTTEDNIHMTHFTHSAQLVEQIGRWSKTSRAEESGQYNFSINVRRSGLYPAALLKMAKSYIH
jgi:hypothetical protein